MRFSVVASVAAIGLLVSGCATAPQPGTYLTDDNATQIVRHLASEAGSKQVVSAKLSEFEASVQVVADKRLETWTLREGAREASRTAIAPLTGAERPIPADRLDLSGSTKALAGSDISQGCSRRGVRVEVEARFGQPLTHLVCLDDSRHQWYAPDLSRYGDVDLRSAEGVTTALADLRRLGGAQQATHVALLFDEQTQVDVETPGACGDVVRCNAQLTSRRALFTSDSPVDSVSRPARLNYAVPFDAGTIDGAQVHRVIKQTMNDRKLNWWRSFTVTIYQVRPGALMMEYKIGSTRFFTDMNGTVLPG